MTALAVGPGVDITVSERGWFAPPLTACRFAVETEIAEWMGYTSLPLARRPKGADNFVRDMQLAGDSTPQNGSTLRQGQKAIRVLMPDAPFLFGALSDAELLAAVAKGAKVGFAVDCSKLAPALKRFVGRSYNGGHYMCFGPSGLSDAMFKPARLAHPQNISYDSFRDAIVRDAAGDVIVVLGFKDAAYLRTQLASLSSQIAAQQDRIAIAGRALADMQAAAAQLQSQIAAQTV